MGNRKLTPYQARMVAELGDYIKENGCRPRAVKEKHGELDRRSDAMYHFSWKAIKAGNAAVVEALVEIGFFDVPTWKENHDRRVWLLHCEEAALYVAENGCLPPQGGEHDSLAHWCCLNRATYAGGDLADWQAALLRECGIADARPCREVARKDAWFASADDYESFVREFSRVPVRVEAPSTEAELREDRLTSWWDNSSSALHRFPDERLVRMAELADLRECLAPPPGGCSIADRALYEVVRALFPKCEVSYRVCMGAVDGPGREVDVLAADEGFAIEFGAYHFHRGKANEDIAKVSLCAEEGVKLVTVIEGVPEDDVAYRAAFEGVPGVVLLADRASISTSGMMSAANSALNALMGDSAPEVGEELMAACLGLARDYVGANRAWYLHAEEVEAYARSCGAGRECRPPRGYRSKVDGIDLNRWCANVKHKLQSGGLSSAQMAFLDSFGFSGLPTYRARRSTRGK